jgi:H+-transporting ATPase
VRYANKPEAWNMHIVLGIATVLGVTGVIASFGLFYLGERVFHLDREFIQSLMYLKLSVAGHLTIFVTRTRGPFWSIRPARVLLAAVGGTQLIATVFAVYGILMMPIGWGWGLAVWGYALAWFLINDRVKLAAYRILTQGSRRCCPGNGSILRRRPPSEPMDRRSATASTPAIFCVIRTGKAGDR